MELGVATEDRAAGLDLVAARRLDGVGDPRHLGTRVELLVTNRAAQRETGGVVLRVHRLRIAVGIEGRGLVLVAPEGQTARPAHVVVATDQIDVEDLVRRAEPDAREQIEDARRVEGRATPEVVGTPRQESVVVRLDVQGKAVVDVEQDAPVRVRAMRVRRIVTGGELHETRHVGALVRECVQLRSSRMQRAPTQGRVLCLRGQGRSRNKGGENQDCNKSERTHAPKKQTSTLSQLLAEFDMFVVVPGSQSVLAPARNDEADRIHAGAVLRSTGCPSVRR